MSVFGAMEAVALVFPHQLFERHPAHEQAVDRWVLIEDSLFFNDPVYPAKMHQQKLWLHRASMKRYAQQLNEGAEVLYLEYDAERPLLEDQLTKLSSAWPQPVRILVVDPVDFVLEKRLRKVCKKRGWQLEILDSPAFLNTRRENDAYAQGRKRWKMADYYRMQRVRLGILMDGDEPTGGKWSFDEENRKKIPKKLLPSIPARLHLERDAIDLEAVDYVRSRFSEHPGALDELYYPSSREDALRWLEVFLHQRLERFGDYEDAIVEGQSWLWHAVLTPVLNIGLLTPQDVVSATLEYAEAERVPLNSLEGFLRQVIGWREFMRATYEELGVTMRNSNHWRHERKMPEAFYDGTTGVLPVDDTVRRIRRTGYCHHIERLMVLGGFFFLCEIHPEEIYRWFMELFVDSYDWVMVPNVFSMSQHADGGLITTKPYFSGSSYIRKMSHYPSGAWCEIWDGLYWSWIFRHEAELRKNPRWSMMCASARRMAPEKMQNHQRHAEEFLRNLK